MNTASDPILKFTYPLIALVLASLAGLIFLFYDSLEVMVRWWSTREEYSHGFLIPLISAYLIWQRSDVLRQIRFESSWPALLVLLAGVFLFFLGEISTVYTIVQYAFLVALYGLVWALVGTRVFKIIAVPLLLLLFMVPFPSFIYNNLSSKLQLISSEIGVFVIRLFGISVFLEGNVIDLGSYKLQVVEACNGLRYLFPLMTLGFIMAYFYHAELWKRAIVFLSTIPITILMNSFRIGVIGVMVDNWGQGMAEGFLHDFEGWVIFMACFGILFVEMWLLMRVTNDKRPLKEAFGIDPPSPIQENATFEEREVPITFLIALVVIAVAIIPAAILPEREETVVLRTSLVEFPEELPGWTGRFEPMEQVYIDTLKFTDYTIINYQNDNGVTVNFYTAFYGSQRKGQSAHSPRSCLPGGGWRIESLSQRKLDEVTMYGKPLRINRVVIGLGEHKQLVYYWFQQRGRIITNEYLVKWYMFVDALFKNRTDGALVRLTVPYRDSQDIGELDAVLTGFAKELGTRLPEYVPE